MCTIVSIHSRNAACAAVRTFLTCVCCCIYIYVYILVSVRIEYWAIKSDSNFLDGKISFFNFLTLWMYIFWRFFSFLWPESFWLDKGVITCNKQIKENLCIFSYLKLILLEFSLSFFINNVLWDSKLYLFILWF